MTEESEMAQCYGLILAGGQSSRMGTDKAELQRNQQTMLQFKQDLLQELGLEVLVSRGVDGIPDLIPQCGPLGGIYSVIRQLQDNRRQADALLIVPVDMPLLTHGVLQHLLSAGESAGAAVCYEDCYLPLYLPVNAALIDYLEQVFAEGSNLPRSMKKMLAAVDSVQLPVAEMKTLVNTNTPEEWLAAKPLIESDNAE